MAKVKVLILEKSKNPDTMQFQYVLKIQSNDPDDEIQVINEKTWTTEYKVNLTQSQLEQLVREALSSNGLGVAVDRTTTKPA